MDHLLEPPPTDGVKPEEDRLLTCMTLLLGDAETGFTSCRRRAGAPRDKPGAEATRVTNARPMYRIALHRARTSRERRALLRRTRVDGGERMSACALCNRAGPASRRSWSASTGSVR
jgi:hypothetical protein